MDLGCGIRDGYIPANWCLQLPCYPRFELILGAEIDAPSDHNQLEKISGRRFAGDKKRDPRTGHLPHQNRILEDFVKILGWDYLEGHKLPGHEVGTFVLDIFVSKVSSK